MTAIEELNESLARHGRFVRLLWICVPLINVFVIGIVAGVIVQNREKAVADAVVQTDNYSRILERSLAGFFATIDITLQTVRDEVSRQLQQGGIQPAQLDAFLARQDGYIPDAMGLRVVDAGGVIRHAVNDVKVRNASIADRPQFIRLRDDPAAGLVFSKPVIGRAAQKPLITMGRRIDRPDGSFGGDVHVAVGIGYFIDLFAKINLGPKGSVALWDNETLLARYTPADAEGTTVGATTPSPELRRHLNSDSVGASYHARSGIDGIARTVYVRRIANYSLFVVVGLADEDYLAEWQRDSWRLAVLASLFVLGSLLAAALINRSWFRHLADQELLIRHEEEYNTELTLSRQEAEAARRRSDLLLASAGEGICGVDLDGKVTFINPAARRMFGWSEDEGVGLDLHAVTHYRHSDGTDYPRADCPLHHTLRDGIRREGKDEVFWRKDGSSFAVDLTAAPIEEAGRVVGAVSVFRDITERKSLEARITRLALFDALTDLPNRSFLSDALPRFAAMALRRQERVGIFYLDLDGFKGINDTRGHAAGDQVLQAVASRLQTCVRAEDVVARLGGDEFLILTLSAPDSAEADCANLAHRMIAVVGQPVELADGPAVVGASIGIALFPEGRRTIEQCVQRADAAMYEAKNAGKGCFVFAAAIEVPAKIGP